MVTVMRLTPIHFFEKVKPNIHLKYFPVPIPTFFGHTFVSVVCAQTRLLFLDFIRFFFRDTTSGKTLLTVNQWTCDVGQSFAVLHILERRKIRLKSSISWPERGANELSVTKGSRIAYEHSEKIRTKFRNEALHEESAGAVSQAKVIMRRKQVNSSWSNLSDSIY